MLAVTIISGIFANKLLEKGQDFLIKKGMDKAYGMVGKALDKNALNPFEKELNKVIQQSLDEYKASIAAIDTSETHFYDSMVFWEFLADTNITNGQFNEDVIIEKISDDKRIVVPTAEEIKDFIVIYNKNIASNTKLAALHIDINYKKEIFAIAKDVRELKEKINKDSLPIDNVVFTALKESINNKDIKIKNILLEEVQQVNNDIEALKIQSAKQHIENFLSKYQEENNYLSQQAIGELFLQLAKCNELLHENAFDNYIKAFHYLPENDEIKAHIGLFYFYMQDLPAAKNIYLEILAEKPDSPLACALKALVEYNGEISSVIKYFPAHLFKELRFTSPLFIWNVRTAGAEIVKIGAHLGMDDYEDRDMDSLVLSHKNLSFWTIFSQYLTLKYFLILKDDETNSPLYQKVRTLLAKITLLLTGTELQKYYSETFFQFHYFTWLNDKEVTRIGSIENYFEKLDKKLLVPGHYIQMLQVASFLQNMPLLQRMEKHLSEGIAAGRYSFYLQTLLARCLELQNKTEEAIEKLLNLINSEQVDEPVLLNLLIIFDGLAEKKIKVGKELIDTINFEVNDYTRLLYCYLKTKFLHLKLDAAEMVLLNKITANNTAELKLQAAKILYVNESYAECINVLNDFLDKSKLAEGTILYCMALYKIASNPEELLSLLSYFRTRNCFHVTLTDIEIEYFYVLKRWQEVKAACNFGLKFKPERRNYLFAKVLALISLDQQEELRLQLDYTDILKFDAGFIENCSKAYLRLKEYIKALDLAFELASKNKLYEQLYFHIFLNTPHEMIKADPIIQAGYHLKYKIDDEEFETICEDDDEFSASLKGKMVNDEFSFVEKFTGKVKTGLITGIANKYEQLHHKLMNNAGNPASSLGMTKISFDPNNIESFNKSLIDTFGKAEEERNKEQQQLFEQYYSNKLSFSELLNQGAFENSFDLYIYLTNNKGSKFISLPYTVFKAKIKSSKKYLLDFTSIPWFYSLHEKGILLTTETFYISSFTKSVLTQFFDLERTNLKSKLRINITSDNVIPTFYSEEFYRQRDDHISSFRKWIDEHTEITNSAGFHTIAHVFDGDRFENDYFRAVVDNALLGQNDFLLLTNDSYYARNNLLLFDNLCNPIHYLEQEGIQPAAINEFLITQNYLGIELNSSILINQYNLYIKDEVNHFDNCIDNLNMELTPIATNPYEAFVFMAGILRDEKYDRDATLIICEKLCIVILKYRNQAFIDLLTLYLLQVFNRDSVNGEEVYKIVERILNAG